MMWLAIGAGVVVVFVAVMFLVGASASKKERAEAPAKLNEARELFRSGKYNETLARLSEAFYVPLGGSYEAADAKTAFGAIALVEETLARMGVEQSKKVAALKARLERIQGSGGEVDDSLTDPVKEFLSKLKDDASMVAGLLKGLESGDFSVAESDGWTSASEPTDEEAAVTNKVGRCIMGGKLQEAVVIIDAALPSAGADFKADLLNQRGGVYFMMKKYENAAADYRECIGLQPDRAMHESNLAEALEKLGQKAEAIAAAEAALNKRGSKDEKGTAREVISRLRAA